MKKIRIIIGLMLTLLVFCFSSLSFAYDNDINYAAEQVSLCKQKIKEINTMQSLTHELAEMKRINGIPEESELIQNLIVNWNTLETEKADYITLLEYYKTIVDSFIVETYEPFAKSNLTEQQLNVLLTETGLSEYGYAFYNMEQEHGVNAVFSIAVAMLESGWGNNPIGNNYFGMVNCKFKSIESGIMYFGELMNEKYLDKTIEQISKKYCPPNSERWNDSVQYIMKDLWKKGLNEN